MAKLAVEPGETTRVRIQHTDGVLDADLTLLSVASSRRPTHRHALDQVPDRPCSACRWTEVRIYRTPTLDSQGRWSYVVRTSGVSSIEGEKRFERVVTTGSAERVLETLTHRSGEKRSLPRISIEAMTEAAGRDNDLRDAWLDVRDAMIEQARVA